MEATLRDVPSPEALAAAAAAYRPRLLAAAERVLRDPCEAEDAVQDALLAALRSLDRFRGDSLLSSWLYRITVNCALMRLRRRRRRPALALEDLPRPLAELPDPAAPHPDERLLAGERLAAVGAGLAGLPPVQRRALELRALHDLPVPEVARRVGRSAHAAKMLVHRAREQLRRELGAAPEPETGGDLAA